jgi:hypothetical protein
MRTTELNPNMADSGRERTASEESKVVGAICANIIDHSEVASKARAQMLISKLGLIAREDHFAFWLVVRVMSGDLSEITRSYSELGKMDGRSKQAFQQNMERSLAIMDRNFPQLANAIASLRCVSAEWRVKVTDEF